MALAPPEASAPPIQTHASIINDGRPCSARNIPPAAVTSNKEMILGLVSVT